MLKVYRHNAGKIQIFVLANPMPSGWKKVAYSSTSTLSSIRECNLSSRSVRSSSSAENPMK